MRTLAPIRERIDLPDTRQYTSFWFRGEEEVPVFGFVLTPRQGDALRRRCRQAQADGKPPVRVRAKVVSSRYAGQMEVVTATVPGESNEEIVVTAHLCHPQPSANDNASGSGALMEVARALGACVQSGRLAKPKRTIRFLWIPEMSGTYAYLASHEADIPRMVAGLNLDMVGENQDLCGSSFLVEAPPLSASSFTPILARHIRDGLLSGGKSHAGLGDYPLFRYADTPFSGGSDHYILSDPSVGVPTPMVIQWPDRFYHTSDDTIDKVDPEMLATVGMLTATYAYWLATARGREAAWLAHEMNARFKQWLMERVQKATAAGMESDTQPSEGPGLKREAAFRVSRHGEALATLRRLADIDVGPFQADAAAFADQELKRAESFLGSKAFSAGTPPSDEFEAKAASLIPERRYRGPLSVRDLTSKPADRETLYQLSKKYESLYSHGVLAVYWADGVRTLAEIADLLELETGSRSTQMLVSFFELLDRIGAVTLHHKASK
jgi:aminopeptidase YwaD